MSKKDRNDGLTEEDLENLSRAFLEAGPNYGGSPWSRIVTAAPDEWKRKWRRTVNKRVKEITEEDLENLEKALDEEAPPTPWSRILDGTKRDTRAEWEDNLRSKYTETLTEEDLENLSGAFDELGPNYGGTPWSKIVRTIPNDARQEWMENLKSQYDQELSEEELEELSGALDTLGPNYGGTPWSRIVSSAPERWKEEWRRQIKNKYPKK